MDVRTLAVLLGITHVMLFGVFSLQASISKAYRGIGWWLLWTASAALGSAFILLRRVPEIARISIVAQNGLIVLSVIFLYVGIMRFLGRREPRGILAAAYTGYVALLAYFLYGHDDIAIRGAIICLAMAAVSFLSARALLVHKTPSIRATAIFCGAVFIFHGLLFAYRSLMILLGADVTDVFSPALFNVAPYLDGILVSLLWGFGLIIMTNQRLNAEMREAKEHFELLFNTIPDAVLITRMEDGCCREVNEGFTAVSGFTRPEVVGRSSLDLELWGDPEDRGRVVRELRDTGACHNIELQFKRKDGTRATGIVSARTLLLDGAEHILSVSRDVTERQREEALRAQLEKERHRAKAAEAMGHLVQGLAHEIRNPLFAISCNVQALQKKLAGDPEVAPFMGFIQEHVARLGSLMKDVVELGRNPAAHAPAAFDLSAAAASAAAEARKEHPGCHILLALPPGPALAFGQRADIERALVHLLANALNHSGSGQPVTLRLEEEQGCWHLEVADAGPGIDERMAAKLFTPFVTTQAGQKGLGLALAKQYVEQQGGAITAANNAPGPGATFTILLPRPESPHRF